MTSKLIAAKGEISLKVRALFQQHQDEVLDPDADGKVIAAHFGGFSQGFIYTLTEEIEKLLISHGDKRHVIRRMFSILIEGLQNVRIHGQKDELGRQVSFLIITRFDDRYNLRMANLIENEVQEKLEDYLKHINGCSLEDLKQTYLDILRRDFMSQSKGAGLGFVTTRIKSGSQIYYDIHPVSANMSLFNFCIDVARK